MTEAQPNPPVPASAPAVRRSPVGWTIVGVVLLVFSLFSFPRGLAGLIASLVRPDGDVAYALGAFSFGAALVVVGIVLLVRAAKIRKENRIADAAVAASQPPAPLPPVG
jgi:hypothetical protein